MVSVASSDGYRSRTGGTSKPPSRAQSVGERSERSQTGNTTRSRPHSQGPPSSAAKSPRVPSVAAASKIASPAGSTMGTPRIGFVKQDFDTLRAMMEELGNLDRQLNKQSSPAVSEGGHDGGDEVLPPGVSALVMISYYKFND